ncbi:hypothetical protein [Streptomyces sp. NPDC002540]
MFRSAPRLAPAPVGIAYRDAGAVGAGVAPALSREPGTRRTCPKIAAYSAGVLTLPAWTTAVEALTSCLPTEGPCRPLPDYDHIRLAITVAAPGAVAAWPLHATLLALARRPKRYL